MPDVGLTTFTDPLPAEARVVIKYSVEVNGLAVYSETYDVKKIATELKTQETDSKTQLATKNNLRRLLHETRRVLGLLDPLPSRWAVLRGGPQGTTERRSRWRQAHASFLFRATRLGSICGLLNARCHFVLTCSDSFHRLNICQLGPRYG